MRTLLRSVSVDLTELRRAPAAGGDVDMGRGQSLNSATFRSKDGNHSDPNPTVEGAIP
jgi:hypothetical protein